MPDAYRTWRLLACLLSGLAFLALFAAPLGTRAGVWDFRFGFTLLRWALYLAIPAILAGLVAAVLGVRAANGRGVLLSVLALALALTAAAIPLAGYRTAKQVPPINDITTDPDDPPHFAAAGRGAENGAAGVPYPGAAFAEQQRAAYPELTTASLPQPPYEVFRAALATAREMPHWEIALADSAAGRVEATATTRWFAFKDDVAIRIRPRGSGSEVDLRSRSRVGVSDVGANAERIRDFRERLHERLGTGPD